MGIKVVLSIWSSPLEDFVEYVKVADKMRLPFIHFDVMDGHFVPNCALGTSQYRDIKKLTDLPIDIHLMVTNPEEYVDMLDVQPGDRVAFHPETSYHPYKLLQTLHDRGITAGLALNPGTSLSSIEELVDQVDYILDMTINPGFNGQKIVPSGMEKIKRIREFLDSHGKKDAEIVIDGNTVIENAKQMYLNGANVLICGPSTLMKGPDKFEDLYNAYKKEIDAVKD